MEYWVMEWSYSSDHVRRYEGPNKDKPVAITADEWHAVNLVGIKGSFEYCLENLAKRVRGEQEQPSWLKYHWRIRDLHSGEVIPGELL